MWKAQRRVRSLSGDKFQRQLCSELLPLLLAVHLHIAPGQPRLFLLFYGLVLCGVHLAASNRNCETRREEAGVLVPHKSARSFLSFLISSQDGFNHMVLKPTLPVLEGLTACILCHLGGCLLYSLKYAPASISEPGISVNVVRPWFPVRTDFLKRSMDHPPLLCPGKRGRGFCWPCNQVFLSYWP